jgi:hypothetical protein
MVRTMDLQNEWLHWERLCSLGEERQCIVQLETGAVGIRNTSQRERKQLLFHALWSFESRPQDRVRRTREALEETPVHSRSGHWGEVPDRRGKKAPKCVISPTPKEFGQLGRSTMLADIAEPLSLPHTVIGWGGLLGTLSWGLSAACPPRGRFSPEGGCRWHISVAATEAG